MRTCYQSQLYKYLQADIRKPRIKTIDELFDHDFTFYDVDHNMLLNVSYLKKKSGTYVVLKKI